MTQHDTHAEASLLYMVKSPPIDTVDAEALVSMIENMGVPVRERRTGPGEYILLVCDTVHVLVAGCGQPFAMDHFRGAVRPPEFGGRESEVLSLLARHGSSLTVMVLDRDGKQVTDSSDLKRRLGRASVDFLLAITTPELVFWSDADLLLTAAEAEAELDGSMNAPDCGAATGPDMAVATFGTDIGFGDRRFTGAPLLREGDIDLRGSEWMANNCPIKPVRPLRLGCSTPRPARLWEEPALSPDARNWLEGTEEPHSIASNEDMVTLRAFLVLDDSADPKRMAETASRRASLYLMSATIGVFALPVGASMLTYNVLSGGSFRATSYMMALTGVGLALTGLGLPNPAVALTFGF